jgi:hypothetical protein
MTMRQRKPSSRNLRGQIQPSQAYALVNNAGVVVARGSAKLMRQQRRQLPGSRVWLTGKPVGSKVE